MNKDQGRSPAEDKKFSNLYRGFDPLILKRVLRRNWIWFPLILIISLSSAWVYLRYKSPVYQSSTVIQLPMREGEGELFEMNPYSNPESDLAADLEVLRSEYLFTQVLNDMELYVSYFSEGDLVTEERYSKSSYKIFPAAKPDSAYTGKDFMVESYDGDKVTLSFGMDGERHRVQLMNGEEYDGVGPKFIFQVMDPEKFAAELSENKLYFRFNDMERLAGRLHDGLMVEILNSDARTVRVLYESSNPDFCRDMVKAVVKAYFRFDMERMRKGSDNVLTFIDNQLDTVYRMLKASQDSISEFRRTSEYSVSEEAILDLRVNMEEERDRLEDLQSQSRVLSRVTDVLSKDPGRLEIYQLQPIVVGTRFEVALGDKLASLHELMKEKEIASFRRKHKNISIQELQERILFEVAMLKSAVNTLADKLVEERIVATGRLQKLESQYFGIPEHEMELSRKTQLHEVNKKYYMLLLERKTQHGITKAGLKSEHLVLQTAKLPMRPLSPNVPLVYVGWGVLGFMLALVILFFKYVSFNEVLSLDDLRSVLGQSVPVLGTIPVVNSSMEVSQLMVDKQSKSRVSEAFRHLRSNIQFVEVNPGQAQVLAVSSSISGEGKTFVTLNLAGILALSGKKVIVLDMDMRRPKLHLGFEDQNRMGVSNILAGKATWQECVNPTGLENLEFISAGPIAPNPSELILRPSFRELVLDLKHHYDYVIFDTPPVGLVSDGINILNEADCPIYVFRSEYSKRNFVMKVRELIEFEKVKRLFVVLNGDRFSMRTSYGFGGKAGCTEYYTEEEDTRTNKWYILRKKRA